MFFEPEADFGKNLNSESCSGTHSFRILLKYLGIYRKYFVQIFLGMLLGCVLELILPFLTQGIVDYGITYRDIGLVWLILLGELMIVAGRTATDFIRRWLLLHISMRVTISLVSDFFIKLLKLPMPFRRKILDYELFASQANNQNKTFQFITSMQEIKLQNCEERRRWEWEDTQADLFDVQLKSLKLQQTQEAGSIFINEIKNILLTVITATAVISGDMTLGAMLAVQFIIDQLNGPIAQFMAFHFLRRGNQCTRC